MESKLQNQNEISQGKYNFAKQITQQQTFRIICNIALTFSSMHVHCQGIAHVLAKHYEIIAKG